MLNEIREKKAKIESRKPFSSEMKKNLRQIDLEDMIFSALRLGGSRLDREDIRNILEGNMLKETTISDNLLIDRYVKLQSEIEDMLEMGNSLNIRTIKRLYATISGKSIEEVAYRRNNPVIYELSYNPPLAQLVEEKMEEFVKKINGPMEEKSDEILKAIEIHNSIIEIWPFSGQTPELARVCLYYYLMEKGYPIFTFNFSEREYFTAIIANMVNEDLLPLYSGVERSLYNKLERILQLTAED